MPSLVTDNFRVFAAEQFIESLEEPYSDSAGTPVDDGDAGGLSDAYRSKIYLFTGRSQPWTLERYAGVNGVTEFDPPPPYDSFNDMNESYDDMISMKRVTRSDVSKVIRKITWKTGVKYDMYKNDYTPAKTSINGQSKLYDSQFYVMNSNYQVYKCIYNGESPTNTTGLASTVEPTGDSTNIIGPLADGYRWKYMYTISIADYIKFVSSDFIPVKEDTAVKNASVDGSIDQLIIKNVGTSNAANTYYCPIIGDSSSPAIARVVVPSGGTGVITTVDLERVGAGYTRATVLLSEAYTNVTNALARSGTTVPLSGSIEPIISPPGGHGSDSSLELGGYRVMINKSLDFLDGNGDIPIDSQFRRFGLVSDPQNVNSSDLTLDTATACYAIKFPTATNVNYSQGEVITQNSTGAKGRVIHWDSVTKVLRYYQNEFIDASQSGQNQYKLVPFSGANSITGAVSNVTVTPDTSQSGVFFGINFTNGYASPEVKKNSGNIIYVENRKAVNRSNDQIEDIKLVIEF